MALNVCTVLQSVTRTLQVTTIMYAGLHEYSAYCDVHACAPLCFDATQTALIRGTHTRTLLATKYRFTIIINVATVISSVNVDEFGESLKMESLNQKALHSAVRVSTRY